MNTTRKFASLRNLIVKKENKTNLHLSKKMQHQLRTGLKRVTDCYKKGGKKSSKWTNEMACFYWQ